MDVQVKAGCLPWAQACMAATLGPLSRPLAQVAESPWILPNQARQSAVGGKEWISLLINITLLVRPWMKHLFCFLGWDWFSLPAIYRSSCRAPCTWNFLMKPLTWLQQKDMKNFLSFASSGIQTEREPLENVKAFVKTWEKHLKPFQRKKTSM